MCCVVALCKPLAEHLRATTGSYHDAQVCKLFDAVRPRDGGKRWTVGMLEQYPDLRLTALGRARAPWKSCWVDLDGVRVRRAQDGGPCLVELAVADESVGFVMGVGVNAAGKITGNGTLFDAHSVMLIPGRTEIRSTSLDSVQWMSVFIPAARLGGQSDRHGLPRGVRSGVMGPTTSGPALRAVLTEVVEAAAVGAFDASPRARADAAAALTDAARMVLRMPTPVQNSSKPLGRPTRPRAEIIQRVHEWLETHSAPTPSLRDLARAADVSTRTLHNVFQEQLAVSPKRFLRVRSLNILRRELRLAGDQGLMVTDVFARLGIWNWGAWPANTRRSSVSFHQTPCDIEPAAGSSVFRADDSGVARGESGVTPRG